jgi:ZIP family zinc transporter
MMSFFNNINPVLAAFLAGVCTFAITALGSACIFLFKRINKDAMNTLLSISAGIMLSSSFFSLINPAIENSEKLNIAPWLVCSLGIICGCLFLFLCDKFYTQKSKNSKKINNLILSITIHNIPEGMAIGVAFGAAKYGLGDATMVSAVMLALGIGIQNFPEGSAISFPLYKEGYSKFKAFLIGALSAIVEPISAVIGALIVVKVGIILPILLSFAGGAMLYVTVVELIPESMASEKKELMALYLVIGFIIMMMLDVALG